MTLSKIYLYHGNIVDLILIMALNKKKAKAMIRLIRSKESIYMCPIWLIHNILIKLKLCVL